ncbi:MAG TPA: hypothetical protein VFQ16_04720 [Burkholderiaceae bacterium]|nr:hypothetical protein [Burkholderiaceae bacterium]
MTGGVRAAKDVSGSMLRLRLRAIEATLPSTDDAGTIAPEVETWHDSTIALEQGLEVVELPVEPEPVSGGEAPPA